MYKSFIELLIIQKENNKILFPLHIITARNQPNLKKV